MATEPAEGDSPAADEGGPVKSFLEHLEDLRWTLVKCAATIAVGVLVFLLAGNYVVAILVRPLEKARIHYPGTNLVLTLSYNSARLRTFTLAPDEEKLFRLVFPAVTNRFAAVKIVPALVDSGTNKIVTAGWQLDTNVNAEDLAEHMNTSITALGPAKAFFIGFRVAIYAAFAVASPLILFFLGQFVLPALRIKERKYLYRGLAFAVPLFVCGVCFCYFILLPAALSASQMYSDWFGFSSAVWDAGDYISFVCKFMLGMGLGFELPVVILVLVKIGLLSYQTLAKARPYMIVANLFLGAILTTPEVLTQVLMAVPLQVLYEISVWIAWYWDRKERKRREAEDAGK